MSFQDHPYSKTIYSEAKTEEGQSERPAGEFGLIVGLVERLATRLSELEERLRPVLSSAPNEGNEKAPEVAARSEMEGLRRALARQIDRLEEIITRIQL